MEFSGTMIVRPTAFAQALDKTASPANAQALIKRAHKFLKKRAVRYYPEVDEFILPVPKGMNEDSYSVVLEQTDLVQYAEPNWRIYPAARPNDPSYPLQWHHGVMESESAWDIGGVLTGSATVIMAIADTGIERTHPDLAPSLMNGYNAVLGQEDTFPGQYTNDLDGHGTFVAGCAGAIGDNGIGVCGMNWHFRIMPIKVTNSEGSANLDVTLAGIRWAIDHVAVGQHIVINASFNSVGSQSVETTGQYVRTGGLNGQHGPGLLVWSAGNNNLSLDGFDPQNVIVVGATDRADHRASFSNYGQAVDVYAPGVDVWSTGLNGGIAEADGTSASAPLVAGICGLVWIADSGLTPDQVEHHLERGCKSLLGTYGSGRDPLLGWGRVNAFQAAKRVVKYIIKPLPVSGGLTEVWGHDINGPGEACGVGFGGLGGEGRGLYWTGGDPPQDLGTLTGTTYAAANGIATLRVGSHETVMTGACWNPGPRGASSRAFKWQAGQMSELPNPLSSTSVAYSINSDSQIVGAAYYSNDTRYSWAICWDGDQVRTLGTLNGYPNSTGVWISDRGQIVGNCYDIVSNNAKALFWSSPTTQPTDVGPQGLAQTFATGINADGVIVGTTWLTLYKAFIYRSGTTQYLDELPGSSYVVANHINDAGQIIGWRNYPNPTQASAVIWNNGYMQDLNDLVHVDSGGGWTLNSAERMNWRGQIVGIGTRNGVRMGYIATPRSDLGQTNLSIRSSIVLEDFLGDLNSDRRAVTFELWRNGQQEEVVPNVYPNLDGSYPLRTQKRGFFDVYAKAAHFLRKKVAAVEFSDFTTQIATPFNLLNGDVDGDNDVDRADLNAVFNALQGGAGIQSITDLNGDGRTTFKDYRICQRNLGRRGD